MEKYPTARSKIHSNYLIFRNASVVYSETKDRLLFQQSRCLVVDQAAGLIKLNKQNSSVSEEELSCFHPAQVIVLKTSQILIPGLVDTHVHAPQFTFVGTGLDLPLLQWLNKYTFPTESKFSDLAHAKKIYQKSIRSHLRNGTTTICYYGTIHLQATKLLADLLEKKGVRGFVGKVCMDTNSPTFYCQKIEDSLKDTRSFIEHLKNQGSSIVPVVTPRFAPTCTGPLLKGLGQIAKTFHVPIQTHLSQNKAQIQWVKQLFPTCQSYTDVYKQHNLLGSKTILAHCVHISEQQLALIKSTKSGISHCPNSNTSLVSGAFRLRHMINSGVKIGLGTDVAGGYSCSMFNAIRQCIGVSKLVFSAIQTEKDRPQPVTLAEAFWLSTRGGAQLLNIHERIGVLESGWQFDALLLDSSDLDCFVQEGQQLSQIFEKSIYTCTHRDIKRIWVKGREMD